MVFPKYGSSPTGGSTIVLLDLIDLQLEDEGRYTCFGENKYGTVEAHGWLKFAKGEWGQSHLLLYFVLEWVLLICTGRDMLINVSPMIIPQSLKLLHPVVPILCCCIL